MQCYEMMNYGQVEAFLLRHLDVLKSLHEAYYFIRLSFPKNKLKLSEFVDREYPYDSHLVIEIAIERPEDLPQAFVQMQALDDAWTLVSAPSNLMVTLGSE